MRVRNIMSSPVVTVTSDMPVLEAAKYMKEKRIERLPVVDGGKLQGIVTKDRVLRASPSMATSLSLHEIHYLFAKLTVKEIMQRDVTTVTPDTTVENAVRLAQEKRVGCLPCWVASDFSSCLYLRDHGLSRGIQRGTLAL